MRTLLLLLALVLLVASAFAFPLKGGNGQVNAEVFGVLPGETLNNNAAQQHKTQVMDVDVFYDSPLQKATIVDSEDKFYDCDRIRGIESQFSSQLGSNIQENTGRVFFEFEVPQGIEIKRLKLTPFVGDPFSINWDKVPEVSSSSLEMKFYGANKNTNGGMQGLSDVWNFDVKITNNDTKKMDISSDAFTILDQYGWFYKAIGDKNTLMPGESMRLDIRSTMSKLSRPVALKYDNLTMDVSAWT